MTAGPTTRRRQLGASLRKLREEKGLSLEEAGRAVGLSKATLSRYETKDGSVKWPLVDALCREYGVADAERASLVDLAKNARVEGWWQSYTEVIPGRMNSLVTLENESVQINHFTAVYVPGLLQTRRYAEALHRTDPDVLSDEIIERSLAVRMKRQEILVRADPLRFSAVLDESVIRRKIGSPEAYREQLGHLLDIAELPNVDIQVLPFDSGPSVSAMDTFMILIGPESSLDVVYLENLTVSLYLEKAEEVDKYHRAFVDIKRRSLGERATIKMLNDLRKAAR